MLVESIGPAEDDDDLNDFTILKEKTDKLKIAAAREEAAKSGVLMKEPEATTID